MSRSTGAAIEPSTTKCHIHARLRRCAPVMTDVRDASGAGRWNYCLDGGTGRVKRSRKAALSADRRQLLAARVRRTSSIASGLERRTQKRHDRSGRLAEQLHLAETGQSAFGRGDRKTGPRVFSPAPRYAGRPVPAARSMPPLVVAPHREGKPPIRETTSATIAAAKAGSLMCCGTRSKR